MTQPSPGTDNGLEGYVKIPLVKGDPELSKRVDKHFASKPIKTSRVFTKKELQALGDKWMKNPQTSGECVNDLFNLIGAYDTP